MTSTNLLFILLTIPLGGAAFSLIIKAFFHKTRQQILGSTIMALTFATMVCCVVFLGLALAHSAVPAGIVGSWNPIIGISFALDGFSYLGIVMLLLVSIPSWFYAWADGLGVAEFNAVYLIQLAAMIACLFTRDLFNLFVCLEILGISTYIQIATHKKGQAFLAALQYLLISAFSMVLFLGGIYIFYRLAGALSYAAIAQYLSTAGPVAPQVKLALAAAFAMVVSAILLRAAVIPFDGWQRDAHGTAPHALSSILSGLVIKVPLFSLMIFLAPLPQAAPLGSILAAIGGASALLGACGALIQVDSKRLLAYSSVSQTAYVVCAWGLGLSVGVHTAAGTALCAAAFLHGLFHSQSKALLFLSTGTATDAAAIAPADVATPHSPRHILKLRGLRKLLIASGDRWNLSTISFIIGAAAIIGLSPFNGYGSKFFLSAASKAYWPYVLLYASGIVTVACFIKLGRIFWGPRPHLGHAEATANSAHIAPPNPVTDSASASAIIPSDTMAVPIIVPGIRRKISSQLFLGLLCIFGGLGAPYLLKLVTMAHRGSPEALAPDFRLYAPQELLLGLIPLALGVGLYLLSASGLGQRLATSLRRLPQGLDWQFLWYSLGLGGIFLVLALH
jgi:formate hydrogenlyase subunit 3/multisubunit Na+/H+ antiporter MnhD subunit